MCRRSILVLFVLVADIFYRRELPKDGRDPLTPTIEAGPSIPNGAPVVTIIIASILIFIICGGAFIAIFIGPFRMSWRHTWAKREAEEQNIEKTENMGIQRYRSQEMV
jgi:hypothetical protein